jgi:arsenate reductase
MKINKKKPVKVYGIKNCDNIKKTKIFLQNNNIEFKFIDFKKDSINVDIIQKFIDTVGIEKIINKRSTTYRSLVDKNITIKTILENPTLIKRPVIENDNMIIVGLQDLL